MPEVGVSAARFHDPSRIGYELGAEFSTCPAFRLLVLSEQMRGE